MNGLMAGKRGLIMGLANDKSLAWGIAKKLAEHGAQLAFSYQGEALAKRVIPLAAELGSDFTFECDVSSMDSLDAAFAALKLGWTPTIRSTFMGSYQDARYPDGFLLTGLANAKAYSGAANLFWSPGKGFDIGVEYRHAIRELTSGDRGALDRIEFAFKYGF